MKVHITLILLFSVSLHSFSQTWYDLNDSLIQCYNNGDFEKGIMVGEKAVIVAKKEFGENHPDYATSLNNLALLYQKTGQYEKAEPLYIQAKEIKKKVLGETHADYAFCINNLADLYQAMGQYEKAEPLYLQAKEIRKNALGEAHPDYATSLNNLAALYQNMGQYGKAELLYIQAKEIWKKVLGENHPDYATSLNNLAFLYQHMGQYEKTEPLYIQAKQILKNVLGENHPNYAMSLNNLALLYYYTGKYAEAEPLFIQAKEIFKKALGETHPYYATSLNNLAGLYESMGQYEKAEPLFIQAKDIRKYMLGEDHPFYARSLNNLAELYKNTGQYEKAEPLYIQAKEIFKNMVGENHPDYATSIGNLAFLYADMNQYQKAESLLTEEKKIQVKNLLYIFSTLSEKEKGDYLANNVFLNNSNNSFLYNHRNASQQFYKDNYNLQLLLKSLALADTKNALEAVRTSKDPAVKKMFIQWQKDKIFLAKQYSLPIAGRTAGLKEREAQTEDLEKELNRLSAEFRNQQNAIRISLQDVQQNLQQDEVAIEFVSFDLYNKKWTDSTIYAAYILHRNDPAPVFIPLCEEKQLQRLFDSAGKTATSMVSHFYRGLEVKNKDANPLGKELYKLVWQPIEPYLKGIKRISYSPAGKLYGIAFHALPVDSSTLLMDKYQLQQYTSTRQVAMRTSKDQITKPGNITLLGNASFTMDSLQLTRQRSGQSKMKKGSASVYTLQKRSSDNNTWNNLPGTAEEVIKIKKLFDQNKITAKIFVQTAASEENLKALSGNSPQILHIATHGFFLPKTVKKKNRFDESNTYTLADDPLLRSGLILAGGNYAWSGKTPVEDVEDGIATSYEISQLNLSNTGLVVLSACETALGDVKGNEGVFGLQRAFKMAGVKKMIVSLWQVPDKETAELMTSFYSYWMKGKSINDAFTRSQADLRKKYSPFYWAGFVLVE